MEQFRKLTLVIAYFLRRRHVGHLFTISSHQKQVLLSRKRLLNHKKISAAVLTHFRQKNKTTIVPLLNYEMLKKPQV